MRGEAPFGVAVLHGGPGAAGEVAPLAEHIAARRGVLEPYQTRATLDGQVCELAETLEEFAELPSSVVGYSWGAMLGLILAARRPALVGKLILVSSAVLDDRWAADISAERLRRMSARQRAEYDVLASGLASPSARERNAAFEGLGRIISEVDSFDPLPSDDTIRYDYGIFDSVWPEAEAMRRSGELIALVSRVRCPVVAIHGGHDPHPAEGVREPLSNVLDDFRFITLPNCGHKPWAERLALGEFFATIDAEVG